MISIILPTRKRVDIFKKSIDSLHNTISNVENFEILVAIDDDDSETYDKIRDYANIKGLPIKTFYYERKFYHGLQEYYNDLALKAKGKFIFTWNDDAIMKTINWDINILEHSNKFVMLSPEVENVPNYKGVLFPIIPRKWIEITKKLSPTHGFDSWMGLISKKLGIFTHLKNVIIIHDRHDLTGNNFDQTFKEVLRSKYNECMRCGFLSEEDYYESEVFKNHYNMLNAHLVSIKGIDDE